MEIKAGQDREKFTISDVEATCGVKASLLRQWQLRYGLIAARQSKVYSASEVTKFLTVSFLYHNGFKVSKVAQLSCEALQHLKNSISIRPGYEISYTLPLIECVIDTNQSLFTQLMIEYCGQVGIENFVLKMGYPLLQKIRLLFPPLRGFAARQTLFSLLIQQQLTAATNALTTTSKGNAVVLFSNDNDSSELDLLLVQYLFKKHGWQTFYFGTGVKWQQLQSLILAKNINSIYVHCNNLSRFEIDDYLESICKAYPQLQVAASGTAVQNAQRTFLNLHLLQSNAAILEFVATPFTSATHTSAHLLL